MIEKSNESKRFTQLDFLKNKNLFSNIPLSVHFATNFIFFTFSYVIFKRNSHFFKFNTRYYSKYWEIFLIGNLIFFFSSGLLLIGKDFLTKYQRNYRKLYEILNEE